MSTDENTDIRTADQIRADIERTRGELGVDVTAAADALSPRVRARQLATTAKTKTVAVAQQTRAAVLPKARQAGRKAGDHWKPLVTGTVAAAAAAATVVVVLQRRRAAQARTADRRWLLNLLNR